MKRLLACLGTALVLAGCSSSGSDALAPKTVDNVDLKRYQGTWYEQARLPMFFQRNCAQSQAQYTLKPDGNVAVLNRCLTEDGEWQEAKGTATPQVPGKTDKLWVEFDNWVSTLLPGVTKGDYWVLRVDPEYQVALIGGPSHKYLWILSKKPHLDEAMYQSYLETARQYGYDLSKLIKTPQQ